MKFNLDFLISPKDQQIEQIPQAMLCPDPEIHLLFKEEKNIAMLQISQESSL